MIHGYGSPETLGHKSIDGLLLGPVVVQEKVDGSQFSAAKIDGRLVFRSRKQEVDDGAAGMFAAGVEAFKEREHRLHEGWIYRGEYLQKPKQVTLAYERTPLGHTILFDVETDLGQHYLTPAQLAEEANAVDLETVPVFHEGEIGLRDSIEPYLESTSVLGGVQIEGVVVKNYNRFNYDGRPLMGKLVRADFKESHKLAWKKSNPTGSDIIERLIAAFRTEARWTKAVQHLGEQGLLVNGPQDIGPLIEEVSADVESEEKEAIKDVLWAWAWPRLRRSIAGGLAPWYKDKLTQAVEERAAA